MKSNNFSTAPALTLVNEAESLRTLKGTEPGDTILVVNKHGQLSLQSVVARAGHRGRQNGHIEVRLMNIATQAMVDHFLYDTLPVGFVSVMKVQIPRRAEKSTTKTTKTAVVARPSQSESREIVTEGTQEVQQSTEVAVVAEAQAVVENVTEEPTVAEIEAAVAEEARGLVEALTSSVAQEEPQQAEAVSGENTPVVVAQEDQPLSFVSVTE